MSQKNAALGWSLHKHLVSKGLETPMIVDKVIVDDQIKIDKIESLIAQLMDTIGLDRTDDSLEETPHRVAKMLVKEQMSGLNYDHFPKCTTVENKFHSNTEPGQIRPFVLLKDLTARSLCEHHHLPVLGTIAISYIPAERVLGLSKFQRVVDFFCNRPQVQERLTEQVCEAISFITGSPDVAVFMDAEHMCMKIRGVKSPCASTATLATRGAFATEHSTLRSEFLAIARK